MQRTGLLALLFSAWVTPAATAIDFNCINIVGDPHPPPDCSNVDHVYYDNVNIPPWCMCLKTQLTGSQAGEPVILQQAVIYTWHQPTSGKYVVTAKGGTLELGGLQRGDELAQLLIDINCAPTCPEHFILDWGFVITDVDERLAQFDVILKPTNQTTNAILEYNPVDAEHAGGLTYRGDVRSGGPDGGFTLTFEYVTDNLPEGAIYPGIQSGDLTRPGFSVPVLFQFPLYEVYTLPKQGPLEVETVVDQIFTDPFLPVQRTFTETFEIKGVEPVKFRRGDANIDGKVDIADSLPESYGQGSQCRDAFDVDDSRVVDLTDSVALLSYLFKAGQPPGAPGPTTPGTDPTPDNLDCASYNPKPPPVLADLALGFEGAPAEITGAAGELKTFDVFATLTIAGNTTELGPRGWSISLTATGGTIKAITLKDVHVSTIFGADRDPATPPVNPFDLELESGAFFHEARLAGADGKEGAFSAVGLKDWPSEGFLQPSGTNRIARITVEAAIPQGQDCVPLTLRYQDGFASSQSQPVPNVVVMDGTSQTPTLGTATVMLCPPRQPAVNWKRCDANGDGDLNITDPIASIGYQFLAGAIECKGALDCDGNGEVNITDVIFDISWQFQAGTRPPGPYPECDNLKQEGGLLDCQYKPPMACAP